MGDALITIFIKLYRATLLQDYTAFIARAEGMGALALEPSMMGGGFNTSLRVNDFLRSYSWTISPSASRYAKS